MSSGMDVQTLMQSLGGGGAPMGGAPMGPPDPAQYADQAPPDSPSDPMQLLTDALTLVRQATDIEDDPQMSSSLEQISSLIQKALASDHSDKLGSMGMKPGLSRILSKAG